ncbi:hypothetical protein [Bacillus kexueae]|uniref:hypothetical protein n=1 Tax=Aeribacillus kexueae TaxID=2078952 RepID=UPI001FAE952D
MTKKTNHSKDIQNHKKPTHQNLLNEEFGTELGDYNAHKMIEILQKQQKDDKC